MAEKYTANPKKLIDQIEREARQRLEPLIEQAQVRYAAPKQPTPSLFLGFAFQC